MPKLPCTQPYRSAPLRDEFRDELELCDGLLVLVLDPVTGAADTYGPYDAERARVEASGRRIELDRENLTDVCVTLVRHHRPR
jgi:hypothetical protein